MFVGFSLRLCEESLFIRKQRENICINKTDAVGIEKSWLLLLPQNSLSHIFTSHLRSVFCYHKTQSKAEIESYDSLSNLNLSQSICSKQMFMWQISEESESVDMYDGNWDLGHIFTWKKWYIVYK